VSRASLISRSTRAAESGGLLSPQSHQNVINECNGDASDQEANDDGECQYIKGPSSDFCHLDLRITAAGTARVRIDRGGGKRRDFTADMANGETSRTKEIADHARSRLKLIRLIIAHVHAKSHATSATVRSDAKKKNPAAKIQQRSVRIVQPSPPGPGLARARANGARRIAKDPKTRKLSLSRLSTRRPAAAEASS
jgi:hypothetical protein